MQNTIGFGEGLIILTFMAWFLPNLFIKYFNVRDLKLARNISIAVPIGMWLLSIGIIANRIPFPVVGWVGAFFVGAIMNYRFKKLLKGPGIQ